MNGAFASSASVSQFLRPNLYFQGLLIFQPVIAAEGHFVAPIGDARVSADVLTLRRWQPALTAATTGRLQSRDLQP